MSFALAYLAEQQAVLPPPAPGDASDWSTLLLTPRYRTSAHVVFLLSRQRGGPPTLVLKAARRQGEGGSLMREAECLRQLTAAFPAGFDSIPRVLAAGSFRGSQVLLETGLAGALLTPRLVARQFAACRDAVADWVLQLHGATYRGPATDGSSAFDRHAAAPLAAAERLFSGEVLLLRRTRSILEALRDVDIGTVFEHGDLCAPNLLLSRDGTLQVVDWELASADGLPAADLSFALAYLAFARRGARTDADRLAAARSGFFGAGAWSAPIFERYRRRLGLAASIMRPLFVLCWLRYVMRLAERLSLEDPARHAAATTAWLRGNRYYQLWHASVLGYDELFVGGDELFA